MSRRSKDTMHFDGELFYSVKSISQASGFSTEWIRKLARDEKITAEKIGGDWWFNRDIVLDQLCPTRSRIVEKPVQVEADFY